MNTLLLVFFAIPFAVIIISIALQKLLRNPFLVAAIIFSVLLVIVLAFFDTIYLIAVLVYTILSFITALVTCIISNNSEQHHGLICNCMGNNNGENNNLVNQNTLVNNNTVDNATTYYTGCYRRK